MGVRRATVAIVAVALLAVAGCSRGAGACALPRVEASVSEARPGQTITVTVDYAYVECYDTGEGVAAPVPQVDIALASADGQRFALVSAVTDKDGHATADVVLPAGIPTGAATIVVTNLPDAEVAPVTISG